MKERYPSPFNDKGQVRRLPVKAWEAEAGREYRGPLFYRIRFKNQTWRCWHTRHSIEFSSLEEIGMGWPYAAEHQLLIAWPGFGPPDEDPAWEPEGGQEEDA